MHEDQYVPPHAASGAAARLRDPLRVRVGHAAVVGTRGREARGSILQLDDRRAALCSAMRLRRRLHKRAPPERVRFHAQSEHHGQRAREADQWLERGDRADGRDTADVEPANPRGRRIRHARRRLVAGLPLGSPMDVDFCYGITPMEHRERYREAFALTLKAWQAREIFAWNGRYYQLAEVNLWPRPIQQPHPPVWVPGSGSISTFDFAVDNDACYCFLSYSGAKAANSMMQRYWQVVSDKGREPNPYRAGFLQLVAVADTDAQAEAKYAKHVEYFYHKCLHLPLHLLSPAGNQDYRSLVASLANPVRRIDDMKSLRYADFVERGYVIAGSPATVRDRLREEVVKELRVGNLMVLLQIGSMPHQLALENIDLFARKVLPEFRDEWNDDGWINYWWPEQLRNRVGESVPVAVGGQ